MQKYSTYYKGTHTEKQFNGYKKRTQEEQDAFNDFFLDMLEELESNSKENTNA